jgi:hypothetical protein
MNIKSFGSHMLASIATVAVIAASIVVLSCEGINWLRDRGLNAGRVPVEISTSTIGLPTTTQQPAEIRFTPSEISGSPEASRGVMEYLDFQRSLLRQISRTDFARPSQRYIASGKILIATKQFPLQSHRRTRRAAISAVCASEQDRGSDMREHLFRRHNQLDVTIRTNLALALGLRQQRFAKCTEKAGPIVDGDIAAAKGI